MGIPSRGFQGDQTSSLRGLSVRTTRVMHHVVSCPCRLLGGRQCACLEPVTAPLPQYMNNSNFMTPHPACRQQDISGFNVRCVFWRRKLAPARRAIASGTLHTKTLAYYRAATTSSSHRLTVHHTRGSTARPLPRFFAVEAYIRDNGFSTCCCSSRVTRPLDHVRLFWVQTYRKALAHLGHSNYKCCLKSAGQI